MNKTIISIAASLAVLGVVFAQVPGGFAGQGPQEAPRPGQTPFPLGQGMRAGGGSASVAASGEYVYVLSNNTLFQFSANGLKLVAKTNVPTVERQGRGNENNDGGGGRRNNPPVN